MKRGKDPKVVVIGLDCAAPELVFERLRGQLPHLERLMARGLSGRLRSCDPPHTVPAWSVMMSGKDPGTLGIYGYRNRLDYSYDKMAFATSTAVREPRLWDYLGRAGKRVLLMGIPQTYPPRPVHGLLVSCFLTPSIEHTYTFPADLKHEIARLAHPYLLDVPDFRSADEARLRRDIFHMAEQHFTLARHFLRTRPWDFFMMVEISNDRVHHAFWKYTDPSHPHYRPGNPWEQVIPEYYRLVDEHIGLLLQEVPEDAVVLVVSDHGAKAMAGGLCINEWLIREGYLVVREYPERPTRLAELAVDWPRTRAWGEGGHYGRVFLNVRGREPQGVIPPGEYEAFRDRLARELAAIPDDQGRSIGTQVFKPQELYRQVNGIPPDLMVYFGGLRWRSVGTVGGKTIHTFENDLGPDAANHAEEGLFILAGPGIPAGQHWHEGTLLDVVPTLMKLFGLEVPPDLQGKPFPLGKEVGVPALAGFGRLKARLQHLLRKGIKTGVRGGDA
ncbi:MAG: alkaline phosphatase family protein [Planctomycetes bacterium]|nr:alkaline phosphatase family protein [Planctomycetota bacterium]